MVGDQATMKWLRSVKNFDDDGLNEVSWQVKAVIGGRSETIGLKKKLQHLFSYDLLTPYL